MKSRKLIKLGLVFIGCSMFLAGCGQEETPTSAQENESTEIVEAKTDTNTDTQVAETYADATQIMLSDDGVTVDGNLASTEDTAAVYTANDIIYYEEGQDFTYGAGTEEDEHSADEAAEHTVVHITEPGSYLISGTLSAGQIAVDLGEDAAEDPEAVVTLILDNAEVTCSVAPAIIFYNVYECGNTDEEQAVKDVDTTAAGANVIIADGSINNISGSYVAKIYKSVELNEDETEVVDSKKLHKYDGAFYSKMSMNVNGGAADTGILNISADNEGLDSELHLTINGGNINITSGNDGINTNEDGISVTTINGGNLNVVVDGATGEGDGIDSNGWIVINGGSVTASACAVSADAGIDSDMGIYINGGTVIASGNMLDEISEDSQQNYLVLGFASSQKGGTTYSIKDADDLIFAECAPFNDFTYLVVSGEALTEGTYSVWMGDTQLSGAMSAGAMGGPGMMGPGNGAEGERPEMPEMPEMFERAEGERPEMPENGEIPEMPERAEGERPEMPENGERPEMPENGERPEMPEDGEMPGNVSAEELSTEFEITTGGNYYMNVSLAEK